MSSSGPNAGQAKKHDLKEELLYAKLSVSLLLDRLAQEQIDSLVIRVVLRDIVEFLDSRRDQEIDAELVKEWGKLQSERKPAKRDVKSLDELFFSKEKA